ncbi:LysM peptidoglycan-binding domain-containing protein [bacterium]|nr:LysM peptidoglycan-binding domain-containing protein [bacterium]
MQRALRTTLMIIFVLGLAVILQTQPVFAQTGPLGDLNGELPEAIVAQATEVPLTPVMTMTPNEDGIITHIVRYGETLWSISEAYGVPISEILANSGLGPNTEQVNEGQRLLIQKATEPTATPTNTPTEDPGTPTPTQPRPTLTPMPTRTPAPTATPTRPPSIFHRALSNGKNVGLGLIIISVLGLIVVVYLGFIKKK